MAGINHVTGEWWWIPGTRGLKRGCPMKDGKIDNKNNTGQDTQLSYVFATQGCRFIYVFYSFTTDGQPIHLPVSPTATSTPKSQTRNVA